MDIFLIVCLIVFVIYVFLLWLVEWFSWDWFLYLIGFFGVDGLGVKYFNGVVKDIC